jgi:parallel beta-helix repeat protein
MSKRKLIWGMVFTSIFFCGIQTSNACSPPPVAVLTVTPSDAGIGTTVIFDGNSSYTLEGDETIVKYEWDFDGDGTYDYYETADTHPDGLFDGITTHAYSSIDTYTAKLRVTDNRWWWQWNTGTDTCTVHVGLVHNITKGQWYNSIQSALNAASDNDIIEVPGGTWNETINFNGINCTVRCTDPNNWDVVEQTIIDANNLSLNVVTFDSGENGNSLLEGFTLRGGNCGVYCSNASNPVIRQCLITDNNSCGIRCISSSPVLRNNKIVGN